MTNPATGTFVRSRVVAWALWDCGSTGLNAMVTTFVFSVYLTSMVGEGMPGGSDPASWLGRAAAAAGLTIALLAPLVGVWVESPHRRRVALGVLTSVTVALTCAMFLIHDSPGYLWAGLALLAATAACSDLASVPYNSMLRQLSTPTTASRISGFGWASGYVGSVVLLILIYLGFVAGSGAHRGLLQLPAHDGFNIRVAMLLAAAWLAVLASPLLLVAHRLPDVGTVPQPATRMLGAYRKLWADISSEWRRDRNLVYFLIASAIFRDGLAAMFAFGAVLGANVYGLTQADVLLFGVAASVVAAVGAVVGGFVDHRVGSKPVIVASLASILISAIVLMVLSGATAFWVCGLLLCLFIGPSQSSARALLLRMAPHGKEGVAFGLYTMTGRAVAFLGPWLFSIFVDIFSAVRAGLGGICLVLAVGLVGMLVVRVPRHGGVVVTETT
ncbi:MFS transporter [Mycobacterium ulcerans]|uniref:MFS transporter n=1 Tax=Mycobacterium ulcerans TaxID=1809 RepID=A0ABY3VAA7_MYCUL|nr:MFS transporter [Mycobacterium ulcerans]MEB3969090.1 MFS transporter [Mycobacterium ulcerans]MEB3977330.1 MFS transporter [Mycobacterium ulcerans]MEB4006669.1 MFS transporter [Mycobacterium ulcerans]MEB4416246.1 MFS transporter [Mycobacterium ulcerans]MEB4434401.1 MFS transporter [Mycobacterium ulcerans]